MKNQKEKLWDWNTTKEEPKEEPKLCFFVKLLDFSVCGSKNLNERIMI